MDNSKKTILGAVIWVPKTVDQYQKCSGYGAGYIAVTTFMKKVKFC